MASDLVTQNLLLAANLISKFKGIISQNTINKVGLLQCDNHWVEFFFYILNLTNTLQNEENLSQNWYIH